MSDQTQREREMTERLRACAEHSWEAKNKDGKLTHRRHFEEIGIRSPEQLFIALEKAARAQDARSFDRLPNPELKQTEPSRILQAKIRDEQGKAHQVTIILNPDRDKEGKAHGGTAYINDPKRETEIHRLLKKEYERGHDPNVMLRGPALSLGEEKAVKTPAYRLKDRYDLNKPTLEREKQVTPRQEAQEQQRQTKGQMTLLERLQQQKPDLSKEVAERQRDRSHAESQVTPKREAQEQQRETKGRMTLLEKLQQQKPDLAKEIGERQRNQERDRSLDLSR